MVSLHSRNNPKPGPRPVVPFPNQHFDQIYVALIHIWRFRHHDAIEAQCQILSDLTNEMIRLGGITPAQGNVVLNEVYTLRNSNPDNVEIWENDWRELRQAVGESGCPGQYFVRLEDEFLP
jgi:hypothetical protein